MVSIRTIVAGGMLALGTLACSSNKRVYQESSGGDVAVSDAVAVLVRNDNYNDVNVYAILGGVSQRLGTVTGNSSGTFSVRASQLTTGQLRLYADPIGGSGRATSGALAVGGGSVVQFTVAPVLSQSSASVR